LTYSLGSSCFVLIRGLITASLKVFIFQRSSEEDLWLLEAFLSGA